MPILQDGQRVWMDFEEFDTTEGIVEWPGNYFETIVQDYLAAGNGRAGKVGDADSYLFEAMSLTAFGITCLQPAPGVSPPHTR